MARTSREIKPLETIWEVPDELWERIEPILLEDAPPPPKEHGRVAGVRLRTPVPSASAGGPDTVRGVRAAKPQEAQGEQPPSRTPSPPQHLLSLREPDTADGVRATSQCPPFKTRATRSGWSIEEFETAKIFDRLVLASHDPPEIHHNHHDLPHILTAP